MTKAFSQNSLLSRERCKALLKLKTLTNYSFTYVIIKLMAAISLHGELRQEFETLLVVLKLVCGSLAPTGCF